VRSSGWTGSLAAVLIVVSFVGASGQQSTRPPSPSRPSTGWVAPRSADGHPSLEGVWENNSATPLERPSQFAGKPRLSDEELADLERRARTLLGPDAEAVFGDELYLTLLADRRSDGLGATGTYSQNWLPNRYFENRTSLIVDPVDGRLPPPTPAGAKMRAAMRRSGQAADSVQGMSLQDRCIHYGFPDLFAGYMSVYRIVQTPEYVAIQMEKIHDTRIVPLDGRPHLSSAIPQYLGDSRGRWDGDTLVVETKNFTDRPGVGMNNTGASAALTITERFTRTSDRTIRYSVTIDDPMTWTARFTLQYDLMRDDRYGMYEYACHEGNYALQNILSGARATER